MSYTKLDDFALEEVEKVDQGLPAVESKGGPGDVVGDTLGKADNVFVERTTDVLKVGKDECLFRIKASGNDVLGVLFAVVNDFIDSSFL